MITGRTAWRLYGCNWIFILLHYFREFESNFNLAEIVWAEMGTCIKIRVGGVLLNLSFIRSIVFLWSIKKEILCYAFRGQWFVGPNEARF